MKHFVAAERACDVDDFSFTVAGELVHLPIEVCDSVQCGCHRAMWGFGSHRATSCFLVRDLQIDESTFALLLLESLAGGGWIDADSKAENEWVHRLAAIHVRLARSLPVESPLRLDDDRIVARASELTPRTRPDMGETPGAGWGRFPIDGASFVPHTRIPDEGRKRWRRSHAEHSGGGPPES